MATLITEAERRLLGAMLDDRTLPLDRVLNADEFSNPAYREVFKAITYTRANSYLEGPELSAQVAKLADTPGIDQETLELLRTQAPTDRDHITAYARMVTDASFMREMRSYSEQLLAEAGPDLDPYDARSLAAMARNANTGLETLNTAIDLDTPGPRGGEAPLPEEQLIASIMANPEQALTLVAIVRPEELQDYRCRAAYEYIASTAWHRDPVSDLDVLYHLNRAERAWINTEIERPDYREPDAAFLQRMRDTPTEPRTGTDAARTIAVDYARLHPRAEQTPSIYERDLAPAPTMQADLTMPTTQQQHTPQPGLPGGHR
jgi:hypothetical protein